MYPDRFPTLQVVADDLGVKYVTVTSWMQKARKLSPVVRQHIVNDMLDEDQLMGLSKYDKGTQEALAEIVIGSDNVGGLSQGRAGLEETRIVRNTSEW